MQRLKETLNLEKVLLCLSKCFWNLKYRTIFLAYIFNFWIDFKNGLLMNRDQFFVKKPEDGYSEDIIYEDNYIGVTNILLRELEMMITVDILQA
jgi:hypothetical protein